MKRWPIIPTVIVGAAVAVMVMLGVWQLQRADWKAHLLAGYAAAACKPPVAWPASRDAADLPLYRKSSLVCQKVIGWRSVSGRNAADMPGYVHIATCVTADEKSSTAQVVTGWSAGPEHPQWIGGTVRGTIAPDARHGLKLVADTPVPGFAPLQPPSLGDIPNNHIAYAVQWFLFALVACVIYVLALRRRRGGD